MRHLWNASDRAALSSAWDHLWGVSQALKEQPKLHSAWLVVQELSTAREVEHCEYWSSESTMRMQVNIRKVMSRANGSYIRDGHMVSVS